MAVEQENHGHSTPRALGVPHNATPCPVYLGTSPQPEPTTALFILISTESLVTKSSKNIHLGCMDGCILRDACVFPGNARPSCWPLAQRSSNSDLFMCTSTAIATSIGGSRSIGDPGISGVT